MPLLKLWTSWSLGPSAWHPCSFLGLSYIPYAILWISIHPRILLMKKNALPSYLLGTFNSFMKFNQIFKFNICVCGLEICTFTLPRTDTFWLVEIWQATAMHIFLSNWLDLYSAICWMLRLLILTFLFIDWLTFDCF